jgi:hypothetical protein
MLRARLDGELSETEAAGVSAHLEQCARCRERLSAMSARAERVASLFSGLGPAAEYVPADTAAAFARLERRKDEPPAPEPLLSRLFVRRFAPAWGAAAAAVLVSVLIASAPGRALAQKMLGLLRVNAVVAVPIERNFIPEGKNDMLQQVLADSVVKTKEGRRVPASNRDEASRLAGYDVLLPSMRQDAPQFAVNTANAFQFTVKQQRLETLLAAVNRTDLQLPAQLDGAKVFVDVAASVEARYGDCPNEKSWHEGPPAHIETCLVVAQSPSPTVVTLPDLDLRAIAEFGLQLTGMTAEQARTFSRTIDWTSTAAIPIPRDVASYETVTVNGVEGILITKPADGGRRKLPPGYALLWAKNGMIYSLGGFGNPGLAVQLAGSLR